jgi:predicted permease
MNDRPRRPPREVIPPRDEVERELAFHIEMRTRDLVARGMDPDVARRAAIAPFGALDHMQHQLRDLARNRDARARRAELLSSVRQDIVVAARALRRQPAFTALATVILGLGVGVTVAILSLARETLFTPPPHVRDAARLVRINRVGPLGATVHHAYPDFAFFDSAQTAFTSVTAYAPDAAAAMVRTTADAEPVSVHFASADFFATLGVPLAHGRAFTGDEDRDGAAGVAVLTRGVAERQFGDASRAVGRAIVLNGSVFTVVGVLPPEFRGGSLEDASADLWLPLRARPLITGRSSRDFERIPGTFHGFLVVVGRMKPGVSVAGAAQDVAAMAARLGVVSSDTIARFGVSAPYSLDPRTREALVRLLRLFGVAAVMVLLIACSNLSNLLLARGAARSKELVVRAALGAGRFRLVRHLVTESLLLAVAGAIVGTLAAIWTARLVETALPSAAGGAGGLDVPMFLSALGVAVGAAVLSSAAAGSQALRFDTVSAFRSATAERAASARLRSALVVAQVALSFGLLVGAGLFVRTLYGVRSMPLGYDVRNQLTAFVDLRAAGYADSAGALFFDRLADRLGALPGVQSAGLALSLPLRGGRRVGSLLVEGIDPPAGRDFFDVDVNPVTPGFFATLGTAMVAGRDFAKSDDGRAPGVVIVNESLARRFWPGQDAVGRQVRRGANAPWLTVVGVVRDARYAAATLEPVPTVFEPFAQNYNARMRVVLRTTGDPLAALNPLRRVVDELDPRIIVRDPLTLAAAYARTTERFARNARLATILGALAVVLSAAGLYAVMSFLATRRRREIGVRMALGARPATVMRAMARDGLVLTAIGVLLGTAIAVVGGRLLTSFLFGVKPFDAVAFAAALAVLAGAALAASVVPARRASRVDPMTALRTD